LRSCALDFESVQWHVSIAVDCVEPVRFHVRMPHLLEVTCERTFLVVVGEVRDLMTKSAESGARPQRARPIGLAGEVG
jgi:hypothetical protein